jgi:hypothetical protein
MRGQNPVKGTRDCLPGRTIVQKRFRPKALSPPVGRYHAWEICETAESFASNPNVQVEAARIAVIGIDGKARSPDRACRGPLLSVSAMAVLLVGNVVTEMDAPTKGRPAFVSTPSNAGAARSIGGEGAQPMESTAQATKRAFRRRIRVA